MAAGRAAQDDGRGDALARTRVLLLGVTAMFGDLVRRMAEADEAIEVVGTVADVGALIETSRDRRADVLLVAVDDGELPPHCRDLLMARPWMRILGIARAGRSGFLWQLLPHRFPLGELSPAALRGAIRGEVDEAGARS
jgi:hypothetical protein